MTSERIQRQIERLLDEAADAISRDDWQMARQRANAALAFDAANADALAYLEAADRAASTQDDSSAPTAAPVARRSSRP